MNDPEAGLRIDLGCGSAKKEATIGVDLLPAPGVDHVVDIEKEALPFSNESVVYAHSSHFLEHIRDPTHIFAEISRVCANNARVEIWTPYAWSNPAFIIDHKLFYTEDIYIHMCVWFIDFWKKILGARWILEEFQYVIEPRTLCYLKEQGISLDFAVRHMHNVVTEFGTYLTVSRNSSDVPSPPVRRTFSTSRLAPRYEIKPDPLAGLLGATGSEGLDNDLIEKAIREFSTGSSLPEF
ncbi:MAG TPA: methyltransferase domain-containing protein [Pyrinomonadaceae bacterium]|jgi:SAM-dependent methyltransferase|nr:methyltransferase domain-containing protein [Pyrinomonadaceae bacterium]